LRQGEKFIGKGREKVENETRGETYIKGALTHNIHVTQEEVVRRKIVDI
jgi:hypothetical protein